mgnify:CR=1 FL=1
MRTAIGTNRNASMRGGNLNVEVGVAHGIADLVIGATGSENGERTRIGNVSRKRKTSSNINHVLFGNTNVEQALCVFRTSLSKFLCGGGAGKGGSIASDYASGGGKNPSASTGVSGSSVVSYAMQFVGNPYVWAGNSLTNGVDCSGFVHEVYAHFGISTPRYSQAFKSVGQAVSFDNIQPGDVVVYPGHVAIYAGGGVIVEAQSTKAGITANRSVQCHTILAIRRLV